MALSETPTSPYDGSLSDALKEEKVEVLRMVAESGREGYEIYDQARAQLQETEEATAERIDSSSRFAPVSLLRSIAGRHTEHLRTAMEAIKSLREAEGLYNEASVRSNTGFMDAALADRSGQMLFDENLERFSSQTREAEFNTRPYDLRARQSVGGGSSGRGSTSGFAQGPAQVPLGLLSEFSGVDLGPKVVYSTPGTKKSTSQGSFRHFSTEPAKKVSRTLKSIRR